MSTAPVDKIATTRTDPPGCPRQRQTVDKAFPLKQLLAILAALIVSATLSAHAAPLRTVTATITRITDGDTVQAVTPEGTKLKVRLYGIDAPETSKGKIPGKEELCLLRPLSPPTRRGLRVAFPVKEAGNQLGNSRLPSCFRVLAL
jgi:hypothetical protein